MPACDLSSEEPFRHAPHSYARRARRCEPVSRGIHLGPWLRWATHVHQHGDHDGGPAHTLEYGFDKRITENFGIAVAGGYQWLRMPGAKTANGWENLEATLKYKVYV